MSSCVFSSTPSAPSADGMHLIGAFSVYQVDHIITCQQSKRRGGPKRVVMQYRVVDDRLTKSGAAAAAAPIPVREIGWKTISVKNFSNRDNISQYERNPYGAMCDDAAGVMVVLHGARTPKNTVSNTVGVNVAGKSLGQHPRFLLSSGKGEQGARSTVLVYAANRNSHVELSKIWIEHRELKVEVEQIDEAELDATTGGRVMVSFAPKFKQVYAQREENGSTSETAAAMSDILPSAVSKPVQLKRAATHTKWSRAAALSRDSSLLSMKTAPARVHHRQVLPPQAMPLALVERLLSRKRQFNALESPVAGDAEVESDEPISKKECTEESALASYGAIPGFAGYDDFDEAGGDLMEHSLALDQAMLTESESLLEVADDESLRSDDATPRVGTTPPPFRHSDSETDSASSDSMLDDPYVPSGGGASFNLADMVCFEQRLEMHDEEPSYCMDSIMDAASASPSMVPHALASAHLLSGNMFCFAPVDLKQATISSVAAAMTLDGAFGGYVSSPPPALFNIHDDQSW